MRELHGIVSGDRLNSQEDLKRYLILFDKLRLVWMGGPTMFGYVDGFTRDPVIEIAEDLAKFNWSKIAKGVLDVRKRKIELLEAEMNAPGRECAYVFDAQERFGG